MIQSLKNTPVHLALLCVLLIAAVLQCSVHIDGDPFYDEAHGAAAVYLATMRACSDAANSMLEASTRESAAVVCVLGYTAIDRYENDKDD
ncbi:MAG: hypothetical protein RIF32_05595 [Leptospirales bacterium]|jgi:hypothetical protein